MKSTRRSPYLAAVFLIAIGLVSVAQAQQLQFASRIPSTQLIGATIGSVVVNVENTDATLVTNSSAAIVVSIKGPSGFSESQTNTAVYGVATFDFPATVLNNPGVYTIAATSEALMPSFQNVGVESTMMPPSGTIFAGAWVNPVMTNGPQNLTQMETSCGRTFALALRYYNWSDPKMASTSNFLSSLANDQANGRIPIVSWESDVVTNLTSGADDYYIASVASAMAAYHGPILLRWFIEMNLIGVNGIPWQGLGYPADGTRPTAAQVAAAQTNYIAAWRHLRHVFEANGAYNVIWLWNPGGGNDSPPGGSGTSYTDGFYPGDDYVDWVGFDAYNRLDDAYLDTFTADPAYTYADLTAHFKPVLIGETGAYFTDELHQVTYFDAAVTTLQTNLPNFQGMDYFDGQGGENWNLTTDGATSGLTEFSNMVNTAYFAARFTNPLSYTQYHSFSARVHVAPAAMAVPQGSNLAVNVSVGGLSAFVPTGTVDIYSDTVWLTNVQLSGGSGNYCQVHTEVKPAVPGVHSLVAVYSGDANNAAGQSWPVPLTIDPPPGFFQLPVVNGGTITLACGAGTNRRYQLQFNADFAHGSWTNLGGPIAATNGVATATDVIGAEAARFYRVVAVP